MAMPAAGLAADPQVHAKAAPATASVDVVLIGSGIMSATLGAMLKELDPTVKIALYERLETLAFESTEAYNNAGTGHSALCELNYTPEKKDGSIDTSKAVQTMEQFEQSKQYWSHLVKTGVVADAREFINPVPHMSWVQGEENVKYLRKRHEALKKIHLFEGMEFSEDPAVLSRWMPAMMQGRISLSHQAATRSDLGTDVDFGKLARAMLKHMDAQPDTDVYLGHEISDLKRDADGRWEVQARDLKSGELKTVLAKFVFIGAGGGTLPLLQKSGIPEAKGYGGFPISGQFLVSKNPQLVEAQNAKVYGRAAVGAPPMSVPHLDTRVIDGKKALIFGPFAGATTKFLKHGSSSALFRSIGLGNLGIMLKAGAQNAELVGYLIDQASQGPEERLQALREFVPDAKLDDWELVEAGKRVQVIKEDPGRKDVLRFGTEVVTASDGSLAALLGASPGASTSVSVMLDVIARSFPEQMKSSAWRAKLQMAFVRSKSFRQCGTHRASARGFETRIRNRLQRAIGRAQVKRLRATTNE